SSTETSWPLAADRLISQLPANTADATTPTSGSTPVTKGRDPSAFPAWASTGAAGRASRHTVAAATAHAAFGRTTTFTRISACRPGTGLGDGRRGPGWPPSGSG